RDGGPAHGGDISNWYRRRSASRRQRPTPRERLRRPLGGKGQGAIERPRRCEPVEDAGNEGVTGTVCVDDRAGNRRGRVSRPAAGAVGDDDVARRLRQAPEVEPLPAVTAAAD